MEVEEIPIASPNSTEEQEENQYKLLVYPVENECIGKITINYNKNDKTKSTKGQLSTIVVLDRSSSMCESTKRFVNLILPQVFQKLQYSPDEVIYLITFDSQTEKMNTTVEMLHQLDVDSRGCTYMASAIEELKNLLMNDLKDQHAIRLLTVSDGELHDQDESLNAANQLATLIENKFELNSQAVRLFTSDYANPDTRGLSSILQLNNLTKVTLLDISKEFSDEDISTAISNLFSEDCLTCQISLKSEESILKRSPWMTEYSNEIMLLPGENIFWLQKSPTEPFTIENINIQVQIQPEINLETYELLLKKKISHYMTQLRILKVVNTTESSTAIKNMVKYFENRENYILNREQDLQLILNNSSLQSRLQYLKMLITRRNKTFSTQMAQIANDEKVSLLNSAQQADYLRTIDTSKNSRGLARRALKEGIDFNETVRKEVLEMSLHVDELQNINDKDHTVSFYSRETTLGGIRALCELVRENLLDELDANDILLLLNIVGVACHGPIGDFPDPMTWRINEIYLGCCVSLSDVLTAFVQSKGTILKTPATEKEITNVIPIFEDMKIAKFLRKYAPSLLEYTSSIGMRRIIADVPMTFGYTLCAAVWKMIEAVNFKKTELHLKTFEKLVRNYENYIGRYFEHILPLIKKQKEKQNSFYIANNGFTNMLSPLITLYRLNNPDNIQYVPDILRALYTYEVWQAVRRLYKNQEQSDIIVKDMLTKLLGIDIDKYKTPLTPLYVPEPDIKDIKFYNNVNLNQSYFEELEKTFYYVKYITLIPKYFHAVVSGEINNINNIPPINEAYICETLQIDYDLKLFNFYNITQALLYTTKASRVDTDNESMKIEDLKYQSAAENMVKDYISKQFENQYLSELAIKKRTEQTQLAAFLVESIIRSKTREEVVELMRNGVKRGEIQIKIANSASLGFSDLNKKILDVQENIPVRLDIIRIFLLGRDHDEIVWNNGGVTFVNNLTEFKNIFKSLGQSDEWGKIVTEYKERGLHIYRQKTNTHGHDNGKPSYWAMGYKILQDYKNDVTDEEFKTYCEKHSKCCGVPRFLALLK